MTKLAFAVLAMMGFAMAACNTVKGAGRDVSAAGRGVENAAQETQEEIDEEF